METGNLLIDTSIIIEYLRKKDKKKSQFYKIVGNYNLFSSAVTLFELFAGAKDEQKLNDIDYVLEYIEIIPFTRETAKLAGEIYLNLRNHNKIIETKDLFIAATALSQDFPLMTLNIKHFERIEGLEIV